MPDIIPTNFMMLEPRMTGRDEPDRAVMKDDRGLDFLVLDELHTRGAGRGRTRPCLFDGCGRRSNRGASASGPPLPWPARGRGRRVGRGCRGARKARGPCETREHHHRDQAAPDAPHPKALGRAPGPGHPVRGAEHHRFQGPPGAPISASAKRTLNREP